MLKGRDRGSIRVLRSLLRVARFLLMEFSLIPLLYCTNWLQSDISNRQTAKPLLR